METKDYTLFGTDFGSADAFKAGKVYDHKSGYITGFIYKSPAFYRDLFKENDGFVFLSSGAGIRPVGFKGYLYSVTPDDRRIMIGTYKSAKKKSYFSLLRREWLAKLLVQDDTPVIKFYVKMWERI